MEKAKETIKRLLALASDANDHESHTALLKAQELMVKHNLKETDFESVDADIEKPRIEKRVVLKGKPHLWLYKLASIVSSNFKVKYYYISLHNNVEFVFLGIESDVDIAEITFNYALASVKHCARDFMQLKHIKRKYKRKYALKRDYIEGYLQGLEKKFIDQIQNCKYELALTLHPAVIEEVELLHLTEGKDTTHNVHDLEAFQTGFEEGSRFGSNLQSIEST
ncbi:DUF2786 domain-containing protein [Lederbergia lenta]|uniref:DUF2786 domain-containing protein n=1 Tax=Lederbergia lenta TaxID=1467 RepID=UPI002041177D|nr:DUF2786 domain-containing protein [Lederbergia lenta]